MLSVVRKEDQMEASAYWRKCLDGFTELEGYLNKITNHKQTVVMTGLPLDGIMAESLTAQRLYIVRQHESLAAIMSNLIRASHTQREDFRFFLSSAAQLEGPVDITIHYLPILISGSAYFGADDATTLEAAKELYGLYAPGPTRLQWKQPAFRAASTVCWLAEYSGRFLDPTNAQTLRVADRQKEEEDRTQLFFECVKERAFHFVLAACQFLKPEIWHDPAKVALVRWLMEDTPSVGDDITRPSPDFVALVVKELQSLSDAFVANMPDALRRLKTEEDDRRRANLSGPAEAGQHDQLDLERFLVIVAYAYQDDPDAAQDFWGDKDSSLYGFLRWTSRRLPTPRVAAFCELLRSIASDEKSGNQAHLFLREDPTMTSGKLRRSYSVSWSQIFSELELYASSVKNRPANPQQLSTQNDTSSEGIFEGETYIMLEVYIRLAAHICRISPDARNWILKEQNFHLGETLFHLASTGSNARVHAVCFDLLAALLTDKITEVNDGMWALLDTWISGGGPGGSSLPRTSRQAHPERHYLNHYASDTETATGLVTLLNALIAPIREQMDVSFGGLPFPENLGAQSRHGGIEVYIDFVLGTAFRSTSSQQALNGELDQTSVNVLRYACLEFVCICLATFNEDLVALANTTNVTVDSAIKTSSLAAYVRLHPFARVMEWLFNNNVILAMSYVSQQSNDQLNEFDPGSPKVLTTFKCVQAMNLAIDRQATYFDIVRPLLNKEGQSRSTIVETRLWRHTTRSS